MSTQPNPLRLRKHALAIALGLCMAGGAHAQSNSTGSIAGTTDAGATVTIENPVTGFRREITAGADGGYRIGSLPTGNYKVTTKGQTRNVAVTIGGTATGSTTNLEAVNVTGNGQINAIDVSSVESTTILTAEQIAKIPVPRNITSVALLAPGTVRGDSAFGNLASFGGSSVAENAYFVNGFNITNAFNNLNFGQIPFEAIAEQQVKTGGYGAEFGRSTGGVINLVTKRGTNEFHAGGNIFITPQSLDGHNPDVRTNGGLNVNTGLVESPRVSAFNGQDSTGNITTASVWASGALVHDRLFAYVLLQYGRTTDADTFGTENALTNTSFSSKQPTWVVKLDWNISDSHLLELTAFSDTNKSETDVYANPDPGLGGVFNAGQALVRQNRLGTVFNEAGGKSYALKYTGYLTDNFTLSALYGHGESSRSNYGVTAGGIVQTYDGAVGGGAQGCPVVIDARATKAPPIVSCAFIGTIGSKKNQDQRDQFRIDAEWQLNDHLLRFGIDTDKFQSFQAQSFEGGVQWRYNATGTRVRKRVFQTGADVEVDSKAFYAEDKWQVTDNLLAYLGLRWDTFENKNGLGETFVKVDNQFGPRLGFSWDVNGDGKFKVFGNAGRYALPLTATVAVRGASASLFTQQVFTYTGTDPVTGAPTGTAPAGALQYLNNEFGVAKNPKGIASDNLEPMYQDEYILGFQAQLTDNISGGVRGIYRNLKRAIDDQCDYRPIKAYAAANGLAYNPQNTGFAYCHLYNPGSDGVFNVDVDGNGTFEKITIPADVLGPKAKRTYKAIEFFAEGQWDKFFLQGSYTWAQSYGNTEGGVKSDNGQTDTGTTQDFDYPELAIGSEGFLPNDRRHSFKLFGNYEINDEWSVGANLLVQSGRPVNCFGFLGGQDTSRYLNSYFSCDPGAPTLPVDGPGNNGTTLVPRGTAGHTPWTRSLDFNVAWQPAFADGRLTFKADVFNVFDAHGVTTVVETGEDATGNPTTSRTYKNPATWQAPRTFRFMVQYEF
jgi:TonB dependent receptor